MSIYRITFIDGTQDSGLASGSPEQVYAYLAAGQRGVSRIDVQDASTLTWPGADEQPTHE